MKVQTGVPSSRQVQFMYLSLRHSSSQNGAKPHSGSKSLRNIKCLCIDWYVLKLLRKLVSSLTELSNFAISVVWWSLCLINSEVSSPLGSLEPFTSGLSMFSVILRYFSLKDGKYIQDLNLQGMTGVPSCLCYQRCSQRSPVAVQVSSSSEFFALGSQKTSRLLIQWNSLEVIFQDFPTLFFLNFLLFGPLAWQQ